MERRLRRRSTCLLLLGLAVGLSATGALAAIVVSARHSTGLDTQPLSIHAEPASRTVAPGASARYAVRVTRGDSGAIGLSGGTRLRVAGGLPAGAAISFDPQRGLLGRVGSRRATTLTVTTAAGTPAGTYLLRVRAHRPRRGGGTAISLVVSGQTTSDPTAPPTPPGPTALPPVAAPDAFTIAGALLDPLTPGAAEPLDLTLANQESTDLSISSLTVDVAGADGPQTDPGHPCGAADFSVEQFSGPLGFTLPASSSASLSELGFAPEEWPQVSMLNLPVNQDGCKQASLALSFTGTAVEATP